MPSLPIPIVPTRLVPRTADWPRRYAAPAPDPDTVPPWWADHFKSRQDKLRRAILLCVKRAGGRAATSTISGTVGWFSGQERQYATDALVRSGRLIREVVREPACRLPGARMVDRVYFRIPEGGP